MLKEWKESQCGNSKLNEKKRSTAKGLKASLTAHVESHSIEHGKDYNFKNEILLVDILKWIDIILIAHL